MEKNMFEVYGGNTVCGVTVSGYGLSNGYLDYRSLAEIVGNMILNNTVEATTIKFKVVNYAEANYDYGIFSNIDATLSTTSAADDSSQIFWNGKSQHSASEKEITYQIPAGQHFIYIKYLKDGSADKNNDCLKFKIATENKVVRRTKKYKYTVDLSADAISHDVHVVFAEKKAEETPTETTN